MSLSITDRSGLLNDELREMAERRLRFALSRFASRISRTELVVFDENGPRGGVDKVCRVSVTLRRATKVVISNRDAEIAASISRAADRAGRAVARAVERTQHFDRSGPIHPNPSAKS